MFLLEGLPAVVLAAVAARALPDSVDQARWLSVTERNWLSQQIEAESPSTSMGLMAALTNRLTILLAVGNIGLYFTLYAVQFFLPQIIAKLSPSLSNLCETLK